MLQQTLIYCILTLLVVLFTQPVHFSVVYLHEWFVKAQVVLSEYITNLWLAKTLTLILAPLCFAGVPAGIYWLIKRKRMPHWLACIWMLWVLCVTSNALIR